MRRPRGGSGLRRHQQESQRGGGRGGRREGGAGAWAPSGPRDRRALDPLSASARFLPCTPRNSPSVNSDLTLEVRTPGWRSLLRTQVTCSALRVAGTTGCPTGCAAVTQNYLKKTNSITEAEFMYHKICPLFTKNQTFLVNLRS